MTAPVSGFIRIEVDDTHAQMVFTRLQERLTVGIPVWMSNDLVGDLQERAQNRFAVGGDDASGPWAPLRPATEAIRSSLGFPASRPINIRTHDLYNYIVGDTGSVSFGAGWTLTWPNLPGDRETLEKLQTAQRGKPSPNTTDRPVVALGPTDYTEILGSLALFITAGLM